MSAFWRTVVDFFPSPGSAGPPHRIYFEQPRRRLNHDAFSGRIDRRADRHDERHEHFTARRLDDEPAPADRSLDVGDDTNLLTLARLHHASDQIVPIEHARRQ